MSQWIRTYFNPSFGNAEIYSKFRTTFSLRKKSVKVEESFVGAGGQNPVFDQKRFSFFTFCKLITKFKLFINSTVLIEKFSSDLLSFIDRKKHKITILNISLQCSYEVRCFLLYVRRFTVLLMSTMCHIKTLPCSIFNIKWIWRRL